MESRSEDTAAGNDETAVSDASSPAVRSPKRTLTNAEKEAILRQRKKARLQDPARLSFILGASSSPASSTSAATTPTSPTADIAVVEEMAHAHEQQEGPRVTAPASLLDDNDGEPAVPQPVVTPVSRGIRGATIPGPWDADPTEFPNLELPPGFAPNAPSGPAAAGLLGPIGMLVGSVLWNRLSSGIFGGPRQAASRPRPSMGKIIGETIYLLFWIAIAATLAWVATGATGGGRVVNVPLSAVLAVSFFAFLRPSRGPSGAANQVIGPAALLQGPFGAVGGIWGQLQLLLFFFVLAFAFFNLPRAQST